MAAKLKVVKDDLLEIDPVVQARDADDQRLKYIFTVEDLMGYLQGLDKKQIVHIHVGDRFKTVFNVNTVGEAVERSTGCERAVTFTIRTKFP